jgi:oxygen-independent coproporphyrinogen-3 oxidase
MAGIYIHIPFCKQKCTYCAFHFSTNLSYTDRMVNALCTEISLREKELNKEPLKTIYLGGGTPSLLTESQLLQLFESLKKAFDLSFLQEVTLEANPDDITEEKVLLWKNHGINRLSIGVQSFDNEDLIWMNRAHHAEQSFKSIQIAQKNGISNLTIDLMYGLPNLTLERWEKQIQQAVDLGVQHISAYCLTVEERTALHKKVNQEELIPADSDLQSEQFDLLVNKLSQHGFLHYEISNFGKLDFIALHNTNYWNGNHYLGIGPSAHSFDGHKRTWTIANNHTYMNNIEKGILPVEEELLTPKNKFNELLMTGLRTIWGVDLTQLASLFPLSNGFNQKVNDYIQEGLMSLSDNHLMLTQAGKHIADSIAENLFEID